MECNFVAALNKELLSSVFKERLLGLHCIAELRAHYFETSQLQNVKPLTSLLMLFSSPCFLDPNAFQSTVITYEKSSNEKPRDWTEVIWRVKSGSSEMSRVLGFAIQLYR